MHALFRRSENRRRDTGRPWYADGILTNKTSTIINVNVQQPNSQAEQISRHPQQYVLINTILASINHYISSTNLNHAVSTNTPRNPQVPELSSQNKVASKVPINSTLDRFIRLIKPQ
jgi:hypothetical protein